MSVEAWTTLLVVLGIWTVGIILNFIVTLIVSHLTAPPPSEIRALVEDLRDPTTHVDELVISGEATALK